MSKYPNEYPDYQYSYKILADRELTMQERQDTVNKFISLNPSFEPQKGQSYEIDYESLWA